MSKKVSTTEPIGMLIIERDGDGDTYCYYESMKQFKSVSAKRKNYRELNWENLANECLLHPDEYFAIPVVAQ